MTIKSTEEKEITKYNKELFAQIVKEADIGSGHMRLVLTVKKSMNVMNVNRNTAEIMNKSLSKLDYYKKQIVAHLTKLEDEESNGTNAFKKSLALNDLLKSYPVGTIREWGGGQFKVKKIAPKKWVRIYEGETRGAKLAIALLKKRVIACKTEKELLELVLANAGRFVDKNGVTLPIVQELSAYIKQEQEDKTTEIIKPLSGITHESDKQSNAPLLNGSTTTILQTAEKSSRNKGTTKKIDEENNKKSKKKFSTLAGVLKTGTSSYVENTILGKVEIPLGNKREGLIHIIQRRYDEFVKGEKLSREEANKNVTAILSLIIDTLENGDVEKQVSGNRWICRKRGFSAIIKKDKNKFLLTGFADNRQKKEATDAMVAVNANYGYRPEFLDVYAQVGAVTTSTTTILQTAEKSSGNKESAFETLSSWANDDVFDEAEGMSKEEIFKKYGNELQSIAVLPKKLLSLFGNITDTNIYCGKGYFIDHMVNHHPEIDVSDYGSIQNIIENPDEIFYDAKSKSNVLTKKNNNSRDITILKKNENGKIVFYKTFYKTKKNMPSKYKKINPDNLSQGLVSDEDRLPSIGRTDVKPAPAGGLYVSGPSDNLTILQTAEKSSGNKDSGNKESAFETLSSWANDDVFDEAEGMSKEKIFKKYGNELQSIAVLPKKLLSLFGNITDTNIYCGKGYFVDHMVNHHPEIDVSDYGSIQNIIDEHKNMYEDSQTKSILFEKDKNAQKEFVVLKLDNENRITFYKTFYYGKKVPKKLKKINPVSDSIKKQGKESDVGERSTISRSDKPNPAASISARSDNVTIPQTAEKSSRNIDDQLFEKMNALAVRVQKKEFSREEYNKTFPRGTVETPLGVVKLGEHQFEKLEQKGRENILEEMYQTLSDPVVVLEEERNGDQARLYVKSFIDDKNNQKTTKIVSIVVDIEGQPVSISTGERKDKQIIAKIKKASRILYEKERAADQTIGTGSITAVAQQDTLSGKSNKMSSETGGKIDIIKQKYNTAKTITGDDDEIQIGKEKINGKWKLVEADVPTTSHDEKTFHKTAGFPETEDGSTINDRDYSHDKAAQETVLTIANDYDGRAVSIDSPVVITQDGIVISGNNRTMSSKLAAIKGTDKEYIATLEKKAKKFGFTREQVKEFKNPRVVFEVVHKGDYTTELFSKFNQNEKKEMGVTEKAVKVAKLIKSETISTVADKISEYETLGEMYQNKNAIQAIFNAFKQNGLVGENEVARYIENESVTDDGKNFIETALLGGVMNESNLRGFNRAGCKSIREKLVRGIVPLIENKNMNGYSINDELNQAVDIVMQVAVNKDKYQDVDTFSRMPNLFSKMPSTVVVELAKKLEGTQKSFAEFMQLVNGGLTAGANGEADIFLGGVETKDAILDRILSIKKSLKHAVSNVLKTIPTNALIKSIIGLNNRLNNSS